MCAYHYKESCSIGQTVDQDMQVTLNNGCYIHDFRGGKQGRLITKGRNESLLITFDAREPWCIMVYAKGNKQHEQAEMRFGRIGHVNYRRLDC